MQVIKAELELNILATVFNNCGVLFALLLGQLDLFINKLQQFIHGSVNEFI